MKDNYYFDNAATTWPKPEPVYQFMDQFFRSHGVNPGRSGSELALQAEQMISETRQLLAGFFGFAGDASRVVFTLNATDSLNIVLRGMLSSGDHMVISQLEHNAVLRSANHLERDHGVRVSRIGHDDQGYLDLDALEEAILPDTRLLVINHASNVLGSVQDLMAIGEIAARHDVCLVVDTAQTAGVVPIDMQAMNIGVLTFTGHKGLFGPMGIGGLIVGEQAEIQPLRFGGTGVNSIDPFQPEDYPYRLEAGTLSMPGVAGLNAAQRWFAETGAAALADGAASDDHRACSLAAIEQIHERENQLASKIARELDGKGRLQLIGSPLSNRPRVSTLSFIVDGVPAQQMADMLDADFHISVRAGLHCAPLVHENFKTAAIGGAVRVSPGYFTDDEDVDHLLTAVSELL